MLRNLAPRRLLGRLFLYNLEMQSFSSNGLKVGLGIRGIVGAIVLGFICLYQPLFGSSSSLLWAKILLVLAAAVYVAFSLIWDRKSSKCGFDPHLGHLASASLCSFEPVLTSL